MTNFDYLTAHSRFASFASVAVVAEQLFLVDIDSCAINTRRAMEFAVHWLYSVDKSLEKPFNTNLINLLRTEEFRKLVGRDLGRRLDLIRTVGNNAAHQSNKVMKGEARLCLENLFIFLDFISQCYGKDPKKRRFDAELLKQASAPEPLPVADIPTPDFDKLMAENAALKEELTARRMEMSIRYSPPPLDLSEFATRKIYIDAALKDANWQEGLNWENELRVEGMPNAREVGFCDYVLFDDQHIPLAVVEAKRSCCDVVKGRHQASLYANCLENKYKRRPVIFLTNGFEMKIIDGVHPERDVAGFYSKRDLEKLFNLRRQRTSLRQVDVKPHIAGRYYQVAAIKAVCQAMDERNRRKALLVMATGSGKTRTVMALCDVLQEHRWVKNILFLADRTSLVTQAKRSFVNLLPNLSVSNLGEANADPKAHCIFSTYQTMMNKIDATQDEVGKLFTVGHFDLVICDEAHRSIYKKYQDIFNYFDAPLVGLTATPKDEIDKNTYNVFELQDGDPTYAYDLAQAVKDEYLVDYMSVETSLKFLTAGIHYDELSPEEREEYENNFTEENGELPPHMPASALNSIIFNADTIRQVLHEVMSNALHLDYGAKIGKTIIFAKNHEHAEKIFEVFNTHYPHLNGYAKVIDHYTTYAQSAIDEFSRADKLPQIAISVDMLDTGIDVPEVLNLVFFKKVFSKSKFWQMIGRGTRLCPALVNGEDKSKFYIFDFCENFEFFREHAGRASANPLHLQGGLFYLKAQLVYKLQDLEYQTEDLIPLRAALVDELLAKIAQLDKSNFAVRQHLRYVESYGKRKAWDALTYEDTLALKEHVAPLLLPDEDEIHALRFDALLYGLEVAFLCGDNYGRARGDLLKRVKAVSKVANIQAIQAQVPLMLEILHGDYLQHAGMNEWEHIRTNLRDLMKYTPRSGVRYDTNFADDLIGTIRREAELENDDLVNYKERVHRYIREHEELPVIAKLKGNIPLTSQDVLALEQMLWADLGTKEQYAKEFGEKPLGAFVRQIVGLSMNAAKSAFADLLNEKHLDSRQIHFVNMMIEYIVHNGMVDDLSVFMESPFSDYGNLSEIFNDTQIWRGIQQVIKQINANVAV